MLNYLGHFGLTTDTAARETQQQYLLAQIETLWQQFSHQFSALMNSECREPALQNSLYQQRFIQQILADSLGYAGCELIRRTVGLAHVADLEKITDVKKRAEAELRAIELGQALIMQRAKLAQMDAVLTLVQQVTV